MKGLSERKIQERYLQKLRNPRAHLGEADVEANTSASFAPARSARR